MTSTPGSPDSAGSKKTPEPPVIEGVVARRRRPLGKSFLLLTRTLHIYVTMFGLILLIFFSFTGFLLNHSDSGEGAKIFDLNVKAEPERVAKFPMELLQGSEHLIAMEQRLRKEFGAKGELDGLPEEDDAAIKFEFMGPGRHMHYEIAKDTGEMKYHAESNILGMLTDLHTGSHSGKWWVWFIDATAVFLFFASVSGLVLWISLPKRRVLGIVALAVGLGLCLGAYFLLVP